MLQITHGIEIKTIALVIETINMLIEAIIHSCSITTHNQLLINQLNSKLGNYFKEVGMMQFKKLLKVVLLSSVTLSIIEVGAVYANPYHSSEQFPSDIDTAGSNSNINTNSNRQFLNETITPNSNISNNRTSDKQSSGNTNESNSNNISQCKFWCNPKLISKAKF